MVVLPVIFAEFFRVVTNNSNSLTHTVASSFVSTSPLAVTTVVGLLETPRFQIGRVKVFPADHMHACSGVHHKLSFLRLHCGCSQQNPLNGRRTECSFFLFFEFTDILGKSPRVSAGASLLSFSLLLRSVLKFYSAGTALTRKFDLYFIQRWTFVFSDVCLTQRSSCELCSSDWSQTFVPFR